MELIGSKEIRSLLLSEVCYLPEKRQDHSKIAVSCSTPKANSRLLTHMVKKLAAAWKRAPPQHTCVSKEDNPQGGQPERRTKDLSQALDSEMPYSLVNSAVPTLSVLLALNSLCSYTLCSQHLHWKNSGHNCAPVCLWASRPWEAVQQKWADFVCPKMLEANSKEMVTPPLLLWGQSCSSHSPNRIVTLVMGWPVQV